ncbi:MAG: hypothetical protein ABNH53_15775 [Henriciella sp.]
MGQTNEELYARIERLEAQLQYIKQELTQLQAPLIRVNEELEAESPTAAPNLGGLQIGDTHIAFTGFVDLDVHMTRFSDGELSSRSLGRDLYISQLTPVNKNEAGEDGFDTDFTAQSSRIGFTTVTPVEDNDLSRSRLLTVSGWERGDL